MELIHKYFGGLNKQQSERFCRLGEIYSHWNEKINVISRKDIESLYMRHVLYSLAIAKFTTFRPGTKIIDVGTGGGFPGIPLAIFFEQCEFHLIDSIGKKIHVVKEVANELALENITASQVRSEDMKEKYDFIVSRAVTALPKFIAQTRHLLSNKNNNDKKNGIVYLKGGDFEDELSQIKRPLQVTPVREYFEETFFETKKVVYIQFFENFRAGHK